MSGVMRLINLARLDDVKWSLKIQPYAIDQHYSIFWSGCEIIHLDDGLTNSLKNILDISGADKGLKWPNGTVSFLAQRFRKWESYFDEEKNDLRYDDFTLRYDRPITGYEAECFKAREALKTNKLLAAYYAYGHVNKKQDGFLRFRIIDFIKFLEYWEKDLLPNPFKKDNKDGSSTFLAWPFKEIPSECIIYEFIEDQNPEPRISLMDFLKIKEVS